METYSIPVIRGLYLAVVATPKEDAQIDLIGVFNSLSVDGFPHRMNEFCLYAQLTDGFGDIAAFAEISEAETGRLVHKTGEYRLHFSSRLQVVQLLLRVRGVQFSKPGVYFVDLYCDNNYLADTRIVLHHD